MPQAGTWFSTEGEQRLKDSYTNDDTVVCTEAAVQHFEEFLAQAKVLHLLGELFFFFFTEEAEKGPYQGCLCFPTAVFLYLP